MKQAVIVLKDILETRVMKMIPVNHSVKVISVHMVDLALKGLDLESIVLVLEASWEILVWKMILVKPSVMTEVVRMKVYVRRVLEIQQPVSVHMDTLAQLVQLTYLSAYLTFA